MKITLYELLGLVKDYKAPKKIRIAGNIYKFDEDYNFYIAEDKNNGFNVVLGGLNSEINLLANAFNENVEILEEQKKIPEKIPEKIIIGKKQPAHRIKKIEKKINEIIDYLKSKGE